MAVSVQHFGFGNATANPSD